jgi:pimeloyl-ACP methyl ester carboxylesterase
MVVDVVILVHGIRDHATWAPKLQTTLEELGLLVEPTNYGRFGFWDFLGRSDVAEREALKRLADQIVEVRNKFPDQRLHMIAHSFGTYLVAQLLCERNSPPLSAPIHKFGGRLVFCGSVVRNDVRWSDFKEQILLPVVNEVGTRDYWPAIARFINDRLGAVGTYGFRSPGVRDRWHSGLRHGDFLNSNFCKKWWVPVIQTGRIEQSDQSERLPLLVDWMGSYHLSQVWPWLAILATTFLMTVGLVCRWLWQLL